MLAHIPSSTVPQLGRQRRFRSQYNSRQRPPGHEDRILQIMARVEVEEPLAKDVDGYQRGWAKRKKCRVGGSVGGKRSAARRQR